MSRPVEIKALSGARALPPLILILYHFCEGHGYRNAAWFDLPVGKGYLWVEFFFALSGFILIHVYGRNVEGFRAGHTYWPFLRARLARLYPVHFVTLISMLILMVSLNQLSYIGGYASIYHQPWPPINTWPSFLANLFLVQGWHLFPWLTWNGASWFVSIEFALCLIFPLFAFWSTGGVKRALLSLAGAIIGLIALTHTTKHGLDITFDNGFLRGVADFTAGVSLAMLYRAAIAAGWQKLPGWVWNGAQALSLIFLLWAWYGTGWGHSRADIWTALALFVFLFAIAFDRGFLAVALSTRTMRALGGWSYGIYMGQTFWLQLIRYFEQHWYPAQNSRIFGLRFGDLQWWIEPFMLVGICIIWGWLLTRFVEHPAAKWLRPPRRPPAK